MKNIHIDFRSVKMSTLNFPDFKRFFLINQYTGIKLKQKNVAIQFPIVRYPSELNIFQQFSPSETEHSNILYNILNPESKHGMGNKFLKHFLETVSDKIFFDNEKWFVTAEAERYDVYIRNVDFTKILILENKSNGANDQPNQLYRYWYYGIYKKQLLMRQCKGEILYVSPNFNKYPDTQTKQPPIELEKENIKMPSDVIKVIFYQNEIDKWLEKCMCAVSEGSAIYFYIKQYRDYWRFYYGV
jgi:hypothetical protein